MGLRESDFNSEGNNATDAVARRITRLGDIHETDESSESKLVVCLFFQFLLERLARPILERPLSRFVPQCLTANVCHGAKMPRSLEKALTWLGLGALLAFNALLTAAPFFFVLEGQVREVSKTPSFARIYTLPDDPIGFWGAMTFHVLIAGVGWRVLISAWRKSTEQR